MKKLLTVAVLAILLTASFLSFRPLDNRVKADTTNPRVITNQNEAQYTISPSFTNFLTYNLTVPAGDIAIRVNLPISPVSAGSNGSVWMTDANGNDISVSKVGIHSSEDADYVVGKYAFRTLYAKVIGFAGGTLTVKLKGEVEGTGQSFNVGFPNTDPRWAISLMATVH